jgi:putative flippase GtrA
VIQKNDAWPGESTVPSTSAFVSRWQRFPRLVALTRHIPPGQFGRYLIVGIWNTLFAYGSFAALVALIDPRISHGYILASFVASPVNITIAFLAYKWFVFKTKGHYLREWMRCVAVYGSGALLNLLLLPVIVEAIRHATRYDRQAPYIAGAVLICFGVIYSFVGHKNFSFRAPS